MRSSCETEPARGQGSRMSATSLQWEQAWQLGAYFTVISLCVNLWDGLLWLDQEATFIWPMPCTAYIKWLYLFGRYFSLAVQIVSFTIQVLYAHPPLSLQFCRQLRTFGGSTATAIMLCFNTLLTIRIYALYGLHTWSSGIATLAVLVEFGAMFASLISTLTVATYDPACIFDPIPESVLPYIVGSLAAQGILVWLAFYKQERRATGRLSVAYVTIRDGIIAFVCIGGFLVFMFILRLYNSPLLSLMVYLFPMIYSIAICHIILNLQRSAAGGPSTDQFSTEIWGLEGSADSYLLTHLEYRPHSS